VSSPHQNREESLYQYMSTDTSCSRCSWTCWPFSWC